MHCMYNGISACITSTAHDSLTWYESQITFTAMQLLFLGFRKAQCEQLVTGVGASYPDFQRGRLIYDLWLVKS